MLLALVATPSAIGATQVNDFTQQVMLGSDLFSTDEDTDFWINSLRPPTSTATVTSTSA
jgi:hypothetical protein